MRKRTRKRRNLKRLYQPQGWAWRGRSSKGGCWKDRELEICSFSGWELYARVDPFGQIAATNFKKNMSSPRGPALLPPLSLSLCQVHPMQSACHPSTSSVRSYPRPMAASRLPGRALMRKISKRRSSSSQVASLNCEKWSGCRYYRAIGNSLHRGCVFDPPLCENIRKGANIEESVLVIRSGNRGV